MSIKKRLQAQDGHKHFEESLKDSLFPPLSGAVLSSRSNDGLSKIVGAIEQPGVADVTLVVDHAGHRIKSPLKQGARFEFSGVARSFESTPFMLNFDVRMDDIEGLQFERLK